MLSRIATAVVTIACIGACSSSMAQVFVPVGTYPAGERPAGVGVADFDGDGILDVAVSNDLARTVSVLKGQQDPRFASPVAYSTVDGQRMMALAQTLVVADLNKDGILDLAVPNEYGSPWHVSTFLGQGEGRFASQVTFETGICPVALVTADLNRDGNLDLITANLNGSSVSVLLGNGNGTFQAATSLATGYSPKSIAVGDFNGDDKPDLLVADNTGVSRFSGTGTGSFGPAEATLLNAGLRYIVAADVNGDGKLDAVGAGYGYDVSVVINAGDGHFSAPVNYPTQLSPGSANPNQVVVADMDGDSFPDLVVVNTSNTVAILHGAGNGTFQAPISFPTGRSPTSLSVADLDGNGLPDIVVTNYDDANISLLMNDNVFAGGFDKHAEVRTGHAYLRSPNRALSLGDTISKSDARRRCVSHPTCRRLPN